MRLWEADTGQTHGNPLTGHTDTVLSAAFSPDGKRVGAQEVNQNLRDGWAKATDRTSRTRAYRIVHQDMASGGEAEQAHDVDLAFAWLYQDVAHGDEPSTVAEKQQREALTDSILPDASGSRPQAVRSAASNSLSQSTRPTL